MSPTVSWLRLTRLFVFVLAAGFFGCLLAAPASAQEGSDAQHPSQSVTPNKVVILVIDEFDYVEPQNLADATDGAVAGSKPVTSTLCLADGSGQGKYVGTRTAEIGHLPISHGELVYQQIVGLVNSGPASGVECSSGEFEDLSNSTYEACSLPNGDQIIVQAVDSDDYSTESVAERTSELMQRWEGNGVQNFVLNMSFVLVPCDPSEFLQPSDDRDELRRYLTGLIAAVRRLTQDNDGLIGNLNSHVVMLNELDRKATQLNHDMPKITSYLNTLNAQPTIDEIKQQLPQPAVNESFMDFNNRLPPMFKLPEIRSFEVPILPVEIHNNTGIIEANSAPSTLLLYPLTSLSTPDELPNQPYYFATITDDPTLNYQHDSVTMIWKTPGNSPTAQDYVFVDPTGRLSQLLQRATEGMIPEVPKFCQDVDKDLFDSMTLLQYANTDGRVVLQLGNTQIFAPDNWNQVNAYYDQISSTLSSCFALAAEMAPTLDGLQAQLSPVDLSRELAVQPFFESPSGEDAIDLTSYHSMFGATPCTRDTPAQGYYSMVCNPISLLLSDTVTAGDNATRTVVAVGASGNFTYYGFPLAPALYPLVVSVSGIVTPTEDRFNPGLVRDDAEMPGDIMASLGFPNAIVQGTSFAAPRIAVLMAQYLLTHGELGKQRCEHWPPLHHPVNWWNHSLDEINLDIGAAAVQYCPPFDD